MLKQYQHEITPPPPSIGTWASINLYWTIKVRKRWRRKFTFLLIFFIVVLTHHAKRTKCNYNQQEGGVEGTSIAMSRAWRCHYCLSSSFFSLVGLGNLWGSRELEDKEGQGSIQTSLFIFYFLNFQMSKQVLGSIQTRYLFLFFFFFIFHHF